MEKICLNCKDTFSPKRADQVFCCRVCSATHNNNRKGTGKIRINCLSCGELITIKSSRKFCDTDCQLQYQYDEFIRKWLNGEIPGGNSSIISEHVRRWLFERSGGTCEAILPSGERCNWSMVNPVTGRVPLTAHHKDGNPERHRPENLEFICPCCHSITPTYGNLNRGNGRKHRKNRLGR